MGNGQTQTFNVGSGTNDPATNTYYTGSGSDSNTLAGLASAINAAAAGSQPTYSGVAGSDTVTSSGTMVVFALFQRRRRRLAIVFSDAILRLVGGGFGCRPGA